MRRVSDVVIAIQQALLIKAIGYPTLRAFTITPGTVRNEIPDPMLDPPCGRQYRFSWRWDPSTWPLRVPQFSRAHTLASTGTGKENGGEERRL